STGPLRGHASTVRGLTSRHSGLTGTNLGSLSRARSLPSRPHSRRGRLRGGLGPPLQLLSATESRRDTPRLVRSLTRLPGSQLHSADLGRLPLVHILQQVEEIHLVLVRYVHPDVVRNTVALNAKLHRARLHV